MHADVRFAETTRDKEMISYVQLCPTESSYTPTAREGQRCRDPIRFTEPNGGHSRDTSGGSGTGLLCRSVNDRSDLEATRSTTSVCNSQPPSLHTVEKSHAGVDRAKCRSFILLVLISTTRMYFLLIQPPKKYIRNPINLNENF